MQERSYVRQVPKEVTLESLKSFYDSAPKQEVAMGSRYKTPSKCFYVNEIGIRAVAGKCNASLEFLMGECLCSPEKSIRYVAFGFLGDIPHSHPGIRKAYNQVCRALHQEQDPVIKEMASRSMIRLREQIKRKTGKILPVK